MNRRLAGFTLVELLVVIGILAVLAAILFPVFGAVRRSARKAACMSNLRQLVMAQKLYSDDNDRTLVPARAAGYTWCVLLQPYMKSDKLIVCGEDDKPQQAAGSEDLPHSYGINYNLTYNTSYGTPFVYSMSSLNRTSDLLLFFDMKPSAQAMGSSYYTSGLTRLDTRHGDRCGIGFLDGHGKMMLPKTTERPVNMWLPG
jgi:prepilin-type N-terminal cleavage/methylation domain-containing protein/prepilin-type processing-associated H-X9-DG protein